MAKSEAAKKRRREKRANKPKFIGPQTQAQAMAAVARANKQPAPAVKEASIARKVLQGLGFVGGRIIAGKEGGTTGYSLANEVATWMGLGAYTVKSNSLVSNVPMAMHKTSQSVVVRHREYVADVVSSSSANAFSVSSYQLNPGLPATFPWLSQIAQCYQEYKFRGIIWEYVSSSADAIASSTNTTLGSVIMATTYRNSLSFTSKPLMLNETFANDGKPSEHLCHPVECDPKENPFQVQYVRGAAVPSGEDVKMYDLGTTCVATVGVQGTSVVLGELWCTYEVELKKPVLTGQGPLAPDSYAGYYANTGFGPINTSHWIDSGITAANDGIGMTLGTNTISFPLGAQAVYFVVYQDTGTSGTPAFPTITGSNGASFALIFAEASSVTWNLVIVGACTCTASPGQIPKLTWSGGTTPGGVNTASLYIMQY